MVRDGGWVGTHIGEQMQTLPTELVTRMGVAIGSDAILMQEAHGAAAIRSSQEIPSDNPGREVLVQFGIEVGERLAHDRIFSAATFAGEWRRTNTGHSMWTYLVPPWSAGPVFAIFYKAAFYDRSAFMRFEARYRITTYEDDGNTQINEARVRDRGTGETLFAVPFECAAGQRHYEAGEAAEAACVEWASANLPADWRDNIKSWLRLMAEKSTT